MKQNKFVLAIFLACLGQECVKTIKITEFGQSEENEAEQEGEGESQAVDSFALMRVKSMLKEASVANS